VEARRRFDGDLAAETESADLSLHTADGACVLEISGMSIKRAARDRFLRARPDDALLHCVLEPLDLPVATPTITLASPRLAALLGLPEITASTTPARLVIDADAPLDDLISILTAALAQPTTSLTFIASGSDPISHGALRGLLRAVRHEHPDTPLRLIDTDLEDPSLILRALESPEPELVLRGSQASAPRLRKPTTPAIDPPTLSSGTLLITGGTGELGRVLARHLVTHHQARHLLLTSRRGPEAPDIATFTRELEALGATVDIAACDITDRDALAALLTTIPTDAPLTAVFHLAGTLDDGLFLDLTPARRARVLAPKLDGARHLDALTRDLPLTAFVLFSSAAGLLGSPGQSSYAAANAALDALASERHRLGLPATSLAWGPWDALGMTAALTPGDLARMRREGLSPLSTARALALLDLALRRGEPVLALLDLDLRPRDHVPAILRGLIATNHRTTELRTRLESLPERERLPHLLLLTRTEIAATLGLTAPDQVPADRPLHELGLDSLMAVDLRNRLTDRTRVTLPSTLAFDHPTAAAIAARLLASLGAPPSRPTLAPTLPTDDHAIAVIGMACRFPGGVEDPAALWQLLARGEDAITDVPARRFDIDAWYDPDPAHPGTTYARTGGFVGEVDGLDAGFFRVAPIEARSLDPQGRLLLECSWEALERAGIVPAALAGTATGVYVGLCGTEYVIDAMADADSIDAYSLLGTAHSAIVGRLSYWLGLEGPNFPVDTACSSSLVALHLACRDLRAGDCDLALTGGANLLLSPEGFVYFSRLQALSPTGRSRAFSADADGYVRAEGCGVLVLKRLADARRDGDPILALVKGSAVNQDGRSNGFTAPNGPAQERVIRRALADARLAPADIDYVECHGTGTALGDPIEVQALAAVYGEQRDPQRPVIIGSIKSNIGHTEGAAGVAGVIKAILGLQHAQIPATLHVGRKNPHVPWDSLPVEVATTARPFPTHDAPHRAAVSSFGFSGTNAHVILEAAEPATTSAVDTPATDRPGEHATPSLEPNTIPLLLSGRGPALAAQAARLASWLRTHPDLRLTDVAFTAAVARTHFPERAALHVATREAALEALDALAEQRPHPSVHTASAREQPGVVFVFSGQGGQWPAMGRALLTQSPAFAATVTACEAAFAALTDLPLRAILAGEHDVPLDRPAAIQPVLYTLALALVAAWRELGVEPAAVVGHSLGEIAAAVVAGALTLEEGARVVAHRGRLLETLTDPGAIAHVELPESETRRRIATHGDALCVAGVNSPGTTIVAGDPRALEALLTSLRAESIFCRPIAMGYASHSRHVDPILPAFRESLKNSLTPRATRIPLYSTITGERTPGESLGAEHWPRSLREPVRLDRALDHLCADRHAVFLEIGPHPVLAMALHAAVPPHGHVAASLTREHGDRSTLIKSLADLHVHGLAVDWPTVLADTNATRVALPTYAFQRERHWLSKRARLDLGAAGLTAITHPIVRATASLADTDAHIFTGRLSLAEQPWLADHVILGVTLFPATGWLELALAAAHHLGHHTLTTLELTAPLALDTTAVALQITIDPPTPDGQRRLRIHTRRGDEPSICNAHGLLAPISTPRSQALPWPPPGAPVDLAALHAEIVRAGVDYGPSFRGLREAWRAGSQFHARIIAPGGLASERHILHPALLDAALHVLALSRVGVDAGTAMLPVAWSDVTIHSTGASELRVRVDLDDTAGSDLATLALHVTDATGAPVLDVGALQFRRASLGALQITDTLYRVDWRPLPLAAAAPSPCHILGDGPLARALGQRPLTDLAELRTLATPPTLLLVDATLAASPALALECVQLLLREPTLARCEFIWISQTTITPPIEDPASAAAWGLLRSARQEHPDRTLRAIDLDAGPIDLDLLHRALAHRDEPELALRNGAALIPRLGRAPTTTPSPLSLDPDGLVWISGAGG
ncbi:MAG TPA: SDR family NAD(P)-dependent oxidoreductase, partial [Nannocystis sp.]